MTTQPTSGRRSEALLPEERLRRRTDFQRCYEQGRRRRGPLVTIYFADRGPEAVHPRLGITVTRKVGGAVVRHRTKRRIREIYRRWSERRRLPPYDLVVHARPAIREADFRQLESEMHRLFTTLLRRDGKTG